MRNRVAFVCSDAGGTEYLAPVITRFRSEAMVPSVVLADPAGVGKNVLERAGITHDVQSVFKPGKLPGIIVCGATCKAHDLLHSATDYGMRHGIPVVWCEDFWATACDPAVMDIKPDHLVVVDRSASDIVRRNRPSLSASRIHVLGRPDFDEFAALKPRGREIALSVWAELGISEHQRLICFWPTHTKQIDFKESATPFLSALRDDPSVVLFVGFHPADEDADTWMQHVRNFIGRDRVVIKTPFSQSELALASCFVATQFSTVAVKAAFLGVPALFMLTPSSQQFLESRGNRKPYFPLIEWHGSAAAYTQQEVEQDTIRLLHNAEYRRQLSAVLDSRFTLPSDATDRVYSFIKSFLP